MLSFKFTIKKPTGEIKTGKIEATSRDNALHLLKKEGGYILSFEEIKRGGLNITIVSTKVPQKDLLVFSKQLSIMLESKITLVESLKIIILEMKNKALKEVLLKVIEDIKAGETLATSLGKHPKIFSGFYVNVVKVGETSGTLSVVLLYLIKHLEDQDRMKSRVKGAMVYPIFVIIVMVVIVGVIFLWIFPTFLMDLLEKPGMEIPWITRAVMNFVNFLTANIMWIVLTIILLIVSFVVANRTKRGKYFFHASLLKLPIIGNIMKKFYMAQFAAIFQTAMTSGLSLIESIDMTEKVIDNMVYKKAISNFGEKSRAGEILSDIVKSEPFLFSSLFIQMLMVGEKTGLLENSLGTISSIYNEEIDQKIKVGISLLEPILLIFMGVLVLVVVLAVFLPIMQMTMMRH